MQAARFIPWDPATQSETGLNNLKGKVVGSLWFDPDTGYEYKLVRLSNALTNDAVAAGEVLCYTAAGGPDFIVTNDVSAAIDGAVAPLPAGIAMGAFSESASATDADAVFILVMVRGKTTLTITGGSVVAGNALQVNPSSDGAVVTWTATTVDPTLTQLELGVISVVGYALADDDANGDVVAWIDIRS